jgi:hypothetical protein
MKSLLVPKYRDDALNRVVAFLEDHDVELLGETREAQVEGVQQALGALPELAKAVKESKELTELLGAVLGGAAGGVLGGPVGGVIGAGLGHIAQKIGGGIKKWFQKGSDKRLSQKHAKWSRLSDREHMKRQIAAMKQHTKGGTSPHETDAFRTSHLRYGRGRRSQASHHDYDDHEDD